MIRLRHTGLLLAVTMVFAFSFTARAQYSFSVNMNYTGNCSEADKYLIQLPTPQVSGFPILADCESVRSSFSATVKSLPNTGCTLQVSVSPCVGSPIGGTVPGSYSSGSSPAAGTSAGYVYNGQGSSFSINPATEVRDWAEDNDLLMNLIGGQAPATYPAVETGDDDFDQQLQKDLEEVPATVKDDSYDFGYIDPSVIQTAPTLEKVDNGSDINALPKGNYQVSPAKEDESFVEKKYNQVQEWMQERDMTGVHDAVDLAEGACSNMFETAVSGITKIGGSLLSTYNSVKGAMGTKEFLSGYATRLVDQAQENAMNGIKYGTPPTDYSEQNQADMDKYVKKSVADKFTGAVFNAFF